MLPIYYINLKKSRERREFMNEHYSKNNIVRISAYNGDKLHNYNDIILPPSTWCRQHKYQIACSLSHIKAIITSLNNDDKEALILEDDVSNEYKHLWENSINEIIENKPENCECLNLLCSNTGELNQISKLRENYVKWNNKLYGAGSYYINRKGMEKIYNLFFKNEKIDLYIKLNNYVSDDGIIYNNLVTYVYSKPTFINQMFKTTIGSRYKVEYNIYKYITNYFNSRLTPPLNDI